VYTVYVGVSVAICAIKYNKLNNTRDYVSNEQFNKIVCITFETAKDIVIIIAINSRLIKAKFLFFDEIRLGL